MKTPRAFGWAGMVAALTLLCGCASAEENGVTGTPINTLSLPAPEFPAEGNLGALLDARQSVRDYSSQPLSLAELSTLLWSAYGFQEDGGRTVPSAGAIYPMSIFVVATDVEGLDSGVYEYRADTHQVELLTGGDMRGELMAAALGQTAVGSSPVTVVVSGDPQRLRERYADRAERYTLLEAGHIGQNLALSAQSLGLGIVTIGAFRDAEVQNALTLPATENVYYLVPVGHLNTD